MEDESDDSLRRRRRALQEDAAEEVNPNLGLLKGLPGKNSAAYMVFGIRFKEGVETD